MFAYFFYLCLQVKVLNITYGNINEPVKRTLYGRCLVDDNKVIKHGNAKGIGTTYQLNAG